MSRILSHIEKIITGILFTWNIGALFRSLSREDPKREEELHYFATRIVRYAAITIIFVVLLFALLLPKTEDNSGIDDVGIFILYLGSVLLICTGAISLKIFRWGLRSKSTIDIFSGHGFQTTMFTIPVIIGLLLWRGGTSFLVVLPIICVSAIAMALTFPTRKRWKKWTEWTSLLD